MKRTFDLGECLDGAQISLAYAARRAQSETTPPDAMAALMQRIERMEATIEKLSSTVSALVAPDRTTPPTLEACQGNPTPQPEVPPEEVPPEEAPPEEAPPEEPELLPALASEAPTSSETPPRCATPDPLDMLSPEQAMLASLLNGGALGDGGGGGGGGGGGAIPQPPPAQPPAPPPPVPPPAQPARGPPGILSEYGGIKGWRAERGC
jgi:hypothetical protein